MSKSFTSQIDSLLQTKARLIEVTIYDLQSTIARKLPSQDSLSNSRIGELLNDKVDKLTPEEYTAQLNAINQSLETYKSEITDTEELAWVEHYSGQLDQLEGAVSSAARSEREIQLPGYERELQQLSQESSGYFQEMMEIISGGLTGESLTGGGVCNVKIGRSSMLRPVQAKEGDRNTEHRLTTFYFRSVQPGLNHCVSLSHSINHSLKRGL